MVAVVEIQNKRVADILSTSGADEVQIVEFTVGDNYYGITIMDVREIIKVATEIVPVPDSHPSLEGAINLRGKIIPVVNLAKHLKIDIKFDIHKSRIIVAEYDGQPVGFWVSSVTRIHRFSKKQIELPTDLVQSKGEYTVAIVKMEKRILFMLDFNKILNDVNRK